MLVPNTNKFMLFSLYIALWKHAMRGKVLVVIHGNFDDF